MDGLEARFGCLEARFGWSKSLFSGVLKLVLGGCEYSFGWSRSSFRWSETVPPKTVNPPFWGPQRYESRKLGSLVEDAGRASPYMLTYYNTVSVYTAHAPKQASLLA